MSKRTARAVIRICDWMIGYHGLIIKEAMQSICMSVVLAASFLAVVVATI